MRHVTRGEMDQTWDKLSHWDNLGKMGHMLGKLKIVNVGRGFMLKHYDFSKYMYSGDRWSNDQKLHGGLTNRI